LKAKSLTVLLVELLVRVLVDDIVLESLGLGNLLVESGDPAITVSWSGGLQVVNETIVREGDAALALGANILDISLNLLVMILAHIFVTYQRNDASWGVLLGSLLDIVEQTLSSLV
jgi:hypothetical protein